MPRYDFRCLACKHCFEQELPFGTKETPPCPACKTKTTQKIIAAPGILFKGTGFYATDSRAPEKEPKKKQAPATKEEKSSSSGSADAPPKQDANSDVSAETGKKPEKKVEKK